MTFYRAALGLLFLSLSGCNCSTKLEQVPDDCDYDPSMCPVPDAGTPDAGEVDAGSVDGGMQCPGGTIIGRICAPDQRTWVNGATVTVDATDCNGKAVELTATSGADGNFEVDGVPAGHWTVHAASGSFSQDLPIDVTVGQTTSIPENQLCVSQGTVKIAVVTGSGDKIETLLDGLSLTYTTIAGDSASWATTAAPFLTDLTQMKQYDIIFFDCAAAHVSSSGSIDLGSHGNQIHQNLQDYVAQGGSVYASDWALVFAYYADPGAIDFLTNGGGAIVTPLPTNNLMGYAPQTVSATVWPTPSSPRSSASRRCRSTSPNRRASRACIGA